MLVMTWMQIMMKKYHFDIVACQMPLVQEKLQGWPFESYRKTF
jgi:hypothetical protein